jgi:hypothetical protein
MQEVGEADRDGVDVVAPQEVLIILVHVWDLERARQLTRAAHVPVGHRDQANPGWGERAHAPRVRRRDPSAADDAVAENGGRHRIPRSPGR